MAENGFIKVNRSILDWEWINHNNTFVVFMHLLLTVNYEDKEWHGITIKRGQRVCSKEKLATECNLKYQPLRTCLEHLESTGEITIKPTRKYSIVTVNNYEKYQQATNSQPQTNQQPTNTPQITNQQLTTTKEIKNKRIKNTRRDIPPLPPKGEAADFENLEEKIDLQAESLAIETVAAPEAKPKNKTSDEHSATLAEHFKIFWEAYPKKVSKPPAEKAFKKLKPDKALLEAMLTGIEKAKKSREWQKNKGEFIPYPSSWLNKRRWEDQETEVLKNGQNGSTYGTNNPNPWLKGFVE